MSEVTKKPKSSTTSAKKKRESKPAAPKKPEAPKLQRGLVADCARLNVRSLAVMTSGIIGILNRGESVLVDPEKSTDGWYAVKIKNGKSGFCMKKYIKIP